MKRALSRATSVACPTKTPSLRVALALLHSALTSRVLRRAGETRTGGTGDAGSMRTSSSIVYNPVTVCSFRVSVPGARQSQRGMEKDEVFCLVRANHGNGAERIDGMELLDNRFAFCHAQHTEGKYHRCHDRQAFWNGCNSQRHCDRR